MTFTQLQQAIAAHLDRTPIGAFPDAVAYELAVVIGASVVDQGKEGA